MDRTEKLLQELTDAHGVPGHEAEVRAVMRRRLAPLGTVSQDRIGSLICALKAPRKGGPRVMLAAHMDEIGFMVRLITDEGFIRFVPLGGWFDQVLLGQRMLVKTGRGDLVGVIGSKPGHLLTQEERTKVVEKKNMYIDIGACSKQQVEAAGVRVGDPIVPDSRFTVLAGGKTYLAKAFDDRVGCALLVEVLEALSRQPAPGAVHGAATVMEEVGLRGAETSVELIDPDVAIVLESGIAGDVPGIKPEESATKLGKGPDMFFYDREMIPNLKLRDLVIETAAKLKIPLQLSAIEGGATDGARIHLHRAGVPTVVVAVPARHIHSHASIIHRDDYDGTLKLVVALVRKLDARTVAGLTK
jgi:putative aminopeptidase FrvX